MKRESMARVIGIDLGTPTAACSDGRWQAQGDREFESCAHHASVVAFTKDGER